MLKIVVDVDDEDGELSLAIDGQKDNWWLDIMGYDEDDHDKCVELQHS